MKRKYSVLKTVLVLLVAILVAPAFLPTQANNVQKSKRKVDVRITYPDGKWVKARSTEGGVIRLQRGGDDFGFTPVISDAGSGEIEVTVSRFKGAETPVEVLETVKVKRQSQGTITTHGSFKVEVFHVGTTSEVSGASPNTSCVKPAGGAQILPAAFAAPAARPDVCCASCDGITACANCSVWIGCGASCCVGDCCGFSG